MIKKVLFAFGLFLFGALIFVAFSKRTAADKPSIGAAAMPPHQPRDETIPRPPRSVGNAPKDAPAASLKQNTKPSPDLGSVSTERASPEEQRAILRRNIDFTFGKAINGLGLSTDEVIRLKEFLVEKGEATYIAKEVANEKRALLEMQAIVAEARAKVDKEIQAYFGDEKYARIKIMEDSATHLLMQKLEYEPALESAGVATLNADQSYRLGALMEEAYGKTNIASRATTADANSGLTKSDDDILAQASAFLAPAQLSTFQTLLVLRNRKFASKNHD